MQGLPDIPSDKPVLIAGPTASGKSALALSIAERFGGEIVNADALQVFDGWNILTARPPAEDLARVPHHLYGHVPFDASYSVGHWLRDVTPFVTGDIPRPIIVGGTGLYFQALTQGLVEIPETPPALRKEADARRLQHGFEVLLSEIDTATRARIDIQNPMRVQRAWEVLRATGRGLADWQDATPPPLLPLEDTVPIVMQTDPEWLLERITRRFHSMMDAGALDEAKMMEPQYQPHHQSSKAIGVPELMAHLRGDLSREEAIEAAIIASRQYAKRQRTWFRSKMKRWIPYVPD